MQTMGFSTQNHSLRWTPALTTRAFWELPGIILIFGMELRWMRHDTRALCPSQPLHKISEPSSVLGTLTKSRSTVQPQGLALVVSVPEMFFLHLLTANCLSFRPQFTFSLLFMKALSVSPDKTQRVFLCFVSPVSTDDCPTSVG